MAHRHCRSCSPYRVPAKVWFPCLRAHGPCSRRTLQAFTFPFFLVPRLAFFAREQRVDRLGFWTEIEEYAPSH